MYSAAKPTSRATRADKPSYTPGHTISLLESLSICRSFVAGESLGMSLPADVADGMVSAPIGSFLKSRGSS